MPFRHALTTRRWSTAAGRPILVVGDVMLDHFVIGRVERISPEAPVPVVCFEQEQYRLAAPPTSRTTSPRSAAASSSSAWSATTSRPPPAHRPDAAARPRRAGHRSSRCTTRKLRVVTTRNQQVARIDYESDRGRGGLQDALAARCATAPPAPPSSCSPIIRRARSRRASRSGDRRRARRTGSGADRPEGAARRLLQRRVAHHAQSPRGRSGVTLMRIRSAEEAPPAAYRFRERVGCESVLITRGEHGMWLLAPSGEYVAPAEAREVSRTSPAPATR